MPAVAAYSSGGAVFCGTRARDAGRPFGWVIRRMRDSMPERGAASRATRCSPASSTNRDGRAEACFVCRRREPEEATGDVETAKEAAGECLGAGHGAERGGRHQQIMGKNFHATTRGMWDIESGYFRCTDGGRKQDAVDGAEDAASARLQGQRDDGDSRGATLRSMLWPGRNALSPPLEQYRGCVLPDTRRERMYPTGTLMTAYSGVDIVATETAASGR
ncbi:hypothetical protein C8Q77DRAFT_1147800 [Trametes polyzona]|nr:hypothetical protein C8Q77DRAFT_1147800 [Trametes polyzona]